MDTFPGEKINGIKGNPDDFLYPHWEARKAPVLDKEHFELEYEFAKIIAEKTGSNLLDVIRETTCNLRGYGFEFDESGIVPTNVKDGITFENIVERSYKEYLKSEVNSVPVRYHDEGGSRFGCFWYDEAPQEEVADVIRVHFFNAEFDSIGPLDKRKIEERKREIKDVLLDIKKNYQHVKKITGESWMLNIPSFQKLFPQSFVDSLKPDFAVYQWHRGTTIWGQFIDSEYKLKKDLAKELIDRLQALEKIKPLSQLFEHGSHIVPPLYGEASIEDFYKMYEVE